jgi:rubrerythrin
MKPRSYLLACVIGIICFALGVAAARNPKLSPKTTENLMTAIKGEAFAHAKYLLYADQARKNGNTELADLFEKTAKVERLEHLAEEAELVGLIGDDQANLKDAIKGESYEVETMYRDFAKQAKAAGDTKAADLFEEIRKDETGHRDGFKAALEKLTPKVAVKK